MQRVIVDVLHDFHGKLFLGEIWDWQVRFRRHATVPCIRICSPSEPLPKGGHRIFSATLPSALLRQFLRNCVSPLFQPRQQLRQRDPQRLGNLRQIREAQIRFAPLDGAHEGPMNAEGKFCSECGTVAVTPAATPDATEPVASTPTSGTLLNPAAPPKRKRRWGLVIALGAVGLCWLIFDGVQGYRNAGQPPSIPTPQSLAAANASSS